MSNPEIHLSSPGSLAQMAEGNPDSGSTPERLHSEPQQSPQATTMETRTSKKRKRPNSLMTDSGETKTDSLIRAASLSCDSRRIGLVSTQIASNDTVLILNDQTGQSVVVASNQSTRDALASLVQRDSEAEKKDIVSRMATDEIEMRRVMEEQALKFFAEKDARRNVWSPPIRARPQSQQPRKRSSCKSEPFVDPLTISTKEAQTMFLNYLNFAQPEFAKLNYCLAAPNFVKDQSFPVEGSTNPSSILSVSQECVTATAIVVDTSNSVIPPLQELGLSSIPAKASPKKDSRAFFGISRFLEEESTETIELASVSPTKPKKTCVMSKSATNAKKSVNKVSNSPTEKEERPRSVNPKKVTKKTSTAVKEETVTLSGAVNTNDAAAPSVSRETQFPVTKDIPTAVSASNISLQEQQETIRQPLKVEPDDPERSRLFLWAPGTRSNRGRSDSPSHYKTDAELIEFLRKPLEKAREEERQAAQRKLLDPLPKRKPRIKSSAAPASNSNQGMPTEQKFSEQMGDTSCDMASHDYSQFLSTPSDMLLEQQEMESFLQSFDIPNFEHDSDLELYLAEEQTFLAQYSTTEPLTGANDSYLAAVCLDMPLGEAMAQVPLGAIAGHLQTQKELFLSTKVESMSELCGESIEGCVTSKKKHSVKRKPPQSAENNTGSAADQPKKKRAPPKKKQASKETEHQDAMDLQQQQQIHQQQSMYQQPSQQCLPSIANLLPPISGYQKQQNETMIPSCFPYTDRNGVAQEVSGSGSLQEPCASSSSTYQTYNISMNKQDRPNKQQSLASMLKPLTCSSASALPPQQTVDNSNYQTLYSMGPGGEGEFYARYEGQSDYNGPLSNSTEQQFSSGDGHMQYAPLSVESHISYQSQESNAPNSHMSSMPPTPISNASHGSAYSTNPVTNDSQISMSQQNYGLMHSESTTSHHQFQPDLYTQKFLTPMENPHVNYLGTTQQQKSHQSGDPQSSTASSSSNHVQPVTELQSLTPTDIAEFFSASDHQTNGGVNSSIKAPRPREMTPDTSNVQYLANGRKEIINMCGEDDECEMSTCPADCNKCQTKGELAGPNVALEKETNVANGSVLPPPDSEQVSYVQYLPQQHTNSTLNGSLNFLPALPHLKKSKSKSKKRLLMNQLDMDQATLLEKIGRNVPIEGSASNMSIGELLKKNQHLSSSAFANLSFNALSNLSYSTAMNAMNASMTPNSSFSKLSSKTILHSFTKATNGPNSVGDSHLPSNSTDHTHQTAANPVLPAMSNAMNNSTSTTKYSSMPNPTHSSTSTPKSNTRTRNNVKIRNNTLATLNINLGSSQSPIPAVQPEKSDLPEEHDPNKRDSVSETIDTVISNVMGTGDSLQRYLPITALNIPASIKSQHVKTIEKTNQCIASLAKASLQKSKKRSVLSKTLQGAPKRGQQEIDLHYAQIRGNNILRQESSSSCANVSIGMYCNQEDQVPSGKDLPKPPERELTLVERLKQPPQQTVEKKPSGVQGPCSPLYQDKRKPPAVVIQHYDLPTIPQQKISKMLVEPPAHFNNHVQQQLDFKNLTEKEKMQLFRTPSPHIAQEISQKIPKQEMLANSLDASSKSKSQATRRQVSVDIPRETPSPALTRPSSAPCTVPKLPNVTDSKINPKPPTSKSSEEDAEKILQIIKEKMASEANKSDFVMPTERPLPNIGGARTNHVRDIIRYVISVGPLLPEEALGIHEPDCEDFEKEYLEHYESISQMMIEEPCKPEICVDDVLENPELEPALHGRFRKRLAAVRAGKTTITKPPSKKRKPTKTVEESTSKNGNGATTIKAIVVPSVDASPEHCGPSTSAETLSQPLSVLTNDNTNSMGPSPLVSGVQTPTEAFLSQQLDFMQRPVDMEMSTLTNCPLSLEDPQAIAQYNTATYLPSYDGQNSYSRSCANNDPLPLNILEGEDDYLEEEKQRKLATERGKTEHNELGMYFADPMLSSGVAVPDLSFNALTGTSGPHDNLLKSNDDPFLSGNVRNKPPRGLFDLDDEEFDIDKDVIDLSGSDNTRPSTPSVGIIDDHSYGSMESSFHGIFASPTCSPLLRMDNPLQDESVVINTDSDFLSLHNQLSSEGLEYQNGSAECVLSENQHISISGSISREFLKNKPTKCRIPRTNFKTIVKRQAYQLSNAELHQLQYKTTRKRTNEFLNPLDAKGNGFHLMDQLQEEERLGQGTSGNLTVREIVAKHVNHADLVVNAQPTAVADVLEKMEEERTYLMQKVEAEKALNPEVPEPEPRSSAPQRRGFIQWPESSGYGELTVPRKKTNRKNSYSQPDLSPSPSQHQSQ